MNSFRSHYAKLHGYNIKKPTTLYYFIISGTKSSLKDQGKPISRNAYSPNQAVRFLKRAYPEYLHKDIEAIEELPAGLNLKVVPRENPKPPEQLGLNI